MLKYLYFFKKKAKFADINHKQTFVLQYLDSMLFPEMCKIFPPMIVLLTTAATCEPRGRLLPVSRVDVFHVFQIRLSVFETFFTFFTREFSSFFSENSNMSHVTQRQVLRILSLLYKKKAGELWTLHC